MREFRISFKSHKPVSKTYRPKNDNFCLFMTLRFPFWYLYTSNAFIAWWILHFRGKNCPKMCLKINRSVKTPCHRPSVGVALSGLWAAVWTRLHDRWGHPLRRAVGSEVLKRYGDNLFDWIDFFKINTYFLFFWRKTERKKNREFFSPLTHAHFS